MTPLETLLSEADRYKWQPIEKAPKDSEEILLITDESCTVVGYRDRTKESALRSAETTYKLGESFGKATHFRHLDTPDNDIVAKLSAALRVAVDYIGCETSFAAIDEALAKINAICEWKL